MQNQELLDAFFRHEQEIKNFLLKRLRSGSLAADMAHDIYLRIQSLDDLPQIKDARTYLFGIASNMITDYQRMETRRGRLRDENKDAVWAQSNELTPERYALYKAELAHLEAAVAQLDPRCRRVFYLKTYENKTQTEIADLLGVGITTVYKDLKRVMSILARARREFNGEMTEDPNNG